jgi:hypothetical protein
MLKVSKEVEELFLKKVRELLIEGKTRKTVKSKSTRKYIYSITSDGNFEMTGKEVTFNNEKIDFFDGIPEKILDLVYQSLSTENSIKHLENLGYVVIDPTLVNSGDDSNQGLSETTINLIKSKILGIN